MSLTSHIRDPKSPVQNWFASRLPNTRDSAEQANRTLRAGHKGPRWANIDGAHGPTVGTAAHFLLCAGLEPEAPYGFRTAVEGAGRLDAKPGDFPAAGSVARAVFEAMPAISGVSAACFGPAHLAALEAIGRIVEMAPWERRLRDEDWRELCALCLLLAAFEQCYRGGAVVARQMRATRLAEGMRSLSDFRAALVRPLDLEDLIKLGRGAVDAFLAQVGGRPRPWHLNPTFAQGAALGGADADIICGGLLVEWKSSAQTGIVGGTELWQLAGYLLADTPDEYRIRAVGVQALRWGGWATWSAEGYLERLSGCERSLPDWRTEFADVLAQISPADR